MNPLTSLRAPIDAEEEIAALTLHIDELLSGNRAG